VSRLFVGLSLALIASVALNVSYLMQHAAATHAPAVDIRRPLHTVVGLFSKPLWLAGGALGLLGWAMHIAALTRAPISLVQAFLVGGIALVAPLAVHFLGHHLSRSEIAGVILMGVALFALTVGRGHVGLHSGFRARALGSYVIVSCVLAGALLLTDAPRAQALGLAGGILYGAADLSIKALTGIGTDDGVTAVLRSPWLLAAAVTSIAAFFCFQRGLQSGNALPVIALMTAGTNVISIVGGLLVFGDPLGRRPPFIVLHLAAFVLVAVAAWLMAPAQAAMTTGPEGH
jgi:drug/metabolite transporter (DMT)-like permease